MNREYVYICLILVTGVAVYFAIAFKIESDRAKRLIVQNIKLSQPNIYQRLIDTFPRIIYLFSLCIK